MTDRRHPGERLSAFLDDELEEAEALAVTRHLAECDDCLRELEDLRAARAALRGLPTLRPPASFFEDVVAVAQSAESTHRTLRMASVALAGVAGLLTVAFLVGGEQGEVVPPVDLVVVDHVARTGNSIVIAPVDLSTR